MDKLTILTKEDIKNATGLSTEHSCHKTQARCTAWQLYDQLAHEAYMLSSSDVTRRQHYDELIRKLYLYLVHQDITRVHI